MEFIGLDYVLGALQRHKGDWRAISGETGVPYDTLSKIARGVTEDPGVRTIEKLAENLRRRDEEREPAP